MTRRSAHSIPELDRDGLRRFAFTTGLIIGGLFGLLLPWLFGRDFPLWPWAICIVLLIWGSIAPASLKHVYRVWMLFGLMLNKVTSPLIMALIFFVAVTPLGLLRRLFGRSMPRKGDSSATTYRVMSTKPDSANLERPF